MKFQWFDSVGVLTKVGAGKICEVCQVSHYVIISQSKVGTLIGIHMLSVEQRRWCNRDYRLS